MGLKTTAALVAVCAALAAYLLWIDLPREEARRVAERRGARLLPDLEPARVDGLELRAGAASWRVERDKRGDWSLVRPWPDRAAAGRIGQLLTLLTELRTGREVAAPDADAVPFGLAPPAATLQLVGEGLELELRLGATNPAGDGRYLQRAGGPVQIVRRSATDDLLVAAADLREHRVLAWFPWEEIERLALIPMDGGRQTVLRAAAAGWRLEQPLATAADAARVRQLIETLRRARIVRFLEQPPEVVERRLAAGLAVRLDAAGQPPAAAALRLAPVDREVWAHESDRDTYYVLPGEVLAAVSTPPERLRRPSSQRAPP